MKAKKSVPATHDSTLRAVQALARGSDRAAIAAAFVASLGQRPAFWRAPLCALASALAVTEHEYRAFSKSSPECAECGLLPEVPLAELHERGQCLPGDLAEARAVLERANAEVAPRPDDAAVARLSRILELVSELPSSAREGALATAIRAEKLVLGDRYDVRHVIETLGACGILETPEYPGFTTRWTSFATRQDRPSPRVECDPPIAFWTAGHGVRGSNVEVWFGGLGVHVGAASGPRTEAVAKASRQADRSAARAARSTELELGDVLGIRVNDDWYAAVVVDHHLDKGGRIPILEAIEWRGREAPTLDDLRGKRAAGARSGVKRRKERVAFPDLWKRDDKQARWRTIGGGLPAPDSSHLAPPLGLFGLARVGKDGAGLRMLVDGIRG